VIGGYLTRMLSARTVLELPRLRGHFRTWEFPPCVTDSVEPSGARGDPAGAQTVECGQSVLLEGLEQEWKPARCDGLRGGPRHRRGRPCRAGRSSRYGDGTPAGEAQAGRRTSPPSNCDPRAVSLTRPIPMRNVIAQKRTTRAFCHQLEPEILDEILVSTRPPVDFLCGCVKWARGMTAARKTPRRDQTRRIVLVLAFGVLVRDVGIEALCEAAPVASTHC
jgi:hypothetical protein